MAPVNGESRTLIRKYFCLRCEKTWRIQTQDIGIFAETIKLPNQSDKNCGHVSNLVFKGAEPPVYSDSELKKSPAATRSSGTSSGPEH